MNTKSRATSDGFQHNPRVLARYKIGDVIVRPRRGKPPVKVKVVRDGYLWRGKVQGSLTMISRTITGGHTSGYDYFKLGPVAAKKAINRRRQQRK